jgi:hypothetical protein
MESYPIFPLYGDKMGGDHYDLRTACKKSIVFCDSDSKTIDIRHQNEEAKKAIDETAKKTNRGREGNPSPLS